MRKTIFFWGVFFIFPAVCIAQFNTIKREKKNNQIVSKTELKSTTKEEKRREFEIKRDVFSLPLDCPLIFTSPFGYRNDPFTGKRKFHSGVDLHAKGNAVLAIHKGEVVKVGMEKRGLGLHVKLRWGDITTTYGHLSVVFVIRGDKVNAGDVLGISGSTGRSTGEHLHLSMKYKKNYIDPFIVLKFIERRQEESQ